MKMQRIVWMPLLAAGLLMGCVSLKKAPAEAPKAAAEVKSAPAAMAAATVNVTGAWKWTFVNRQGKTFEGTLKLKQEGNTLTGAASGPNGSETAIENGTVSGNQIAFTTTREHNGQKFTAKHQGEVVGDAIKGTIQTERNGQTRTANWNAARDKKASDPTGTWKWTMNRPGGQSREVTMKLNLLDGKLSGTVSGRQGAETAIENATLTNDEIAFTVTRPGRNGQSFISKFSGKISGDEIKGTITSTRNGLPNSREWDAKRAQ